MKKFFFVLSFIILWFNLRLYTSSFEHQELKNDILHQLNYIGSELKSNDLGNRMQKLFPEGYVFIHALYGLAWCELATADSFNDPMLKSQALNEALFAYDEISSSKSFARFDSQLTPQYGIYYLGWKNYLLSKILCIDTNFSNANKYKKAFVEQCESIDNALQQSPTPYLESYESQTWPADMFVAMASLKQHDQLFIPKYKATLHQWINKIQLLLDSKSNMLPHSVESKTGKPTEGSRGSSMSLMLRLLAEIDPEMAQQQYKLYKKYFVTTTCGLPSIREYPKGTEGQGDIDSGPVIFGIGFSATIVSIGTFSKLGAQKESDQQYKTIHAFGFDYTHKNTKRYVFGLLPIADAFIAWGQATALHSIASPNQPSLFWSFRFHIYSIVLLFLIWIILLWIPSYLKKHEN